MTTWILEYGIQVSNQKSHLSTILGEYMSYILNLDLFVEVIVVVVGVGIVLMNLNIQDIMR